MANKQDAGTAQPKLSDPYGWAGKNGPSYTPTTDREDNVWKGGAGSKEGVTRGTATHGRDLRPETRKRASGK